MDISFEPPYPEHAWIDETLRRWSNRHRREDNLDTVLISNRTDKVIRFLRIKACDMFLFSLFSRAHSLKLSLTHRSEGKGISVEGVNSKMGRLLITVLSFLRTKAVSRWGQSECQCGAKLQVAQFSIERSYTPVGSTLKRPFHPSPQE